MASQALQVWNVWLDQALEDLNESQLGRLLLPVNSATPVSEEAPPRGASGPMAPDFDLVNVATIQTFGQLGPWDRGTVEVEVSSADFGAWLGGVSSPGQQGHGAALRSTANAKESETAFKQLSSSASHKLLLFSGNDYLGLSGHPAVRSAAARAALQCGIGPRAASLICGYTDHHRQLEAALADLKNTEDCLLCPTGFAANMAVMTALAGVVKGGRAEKKGAFAIFSDELNHASIVDGVRLAHKTGLAQVHIYRHSDMKQLEELLSKCKLQRKVVVTDSYWGIEFACWNMGPCSLFHHTVQMILFSMDGDFARMTELATLRKKHGFLLVVDDAHGTLVCGESGGGVAEAYGVENDVDICVGTLSKAIGCLGGFIATSWKWKQWIQSRGRSFIFSTALPIPIVAAAHVAIIVGRKERWRRRALWQRIQQLSHGLGVQFQSPIIPIIIGGADESLLASRSLLKAGFHIFAIRPPTVKEGASRLRITISAAHTESDIEALIKALPKWMKDKGRSQPFLSHGLSLGQQHYGLQEKSASVAQTPSTKVELDGGSEMAFSRHHLGRDQKFEPSINPRL